MSWSRIRIGTGLVAAGIGVLVVSDGPWLLEGLAKENPYKLIPSRNAFGLDEPKSPEPEPEPPKEESKPPPPKVDVTLTGFSEIAGTKKVYFMVPKKDDPKKYDYYAVPEGEGRSGIKVVSIDPKAGKVDVLNRGRKMTLTMEEHGNKLAKSSQGSRRNRSSSSQSSSSGSSSSSSSSPTIIGNSSSDDGKGEENNSSPSDDNNDSQRGDRSRQQRSESASNNRQGGRRGATLISNAGQDQQEKQQVDGREKAARQSVKAAVQREQLRQKGYPTPPFPGMDSQNQGGGN